MFGCASVRNDAVSDTRGYVDVCIKIRRFIEPAIAVIIFVSDKIGCSWVGRAVGEWESISSYSCGSQQDGRLKGVTHFVSIHVVYFKEGVLAERPG